MGEPIRWDTIMSRTPDSAPGMATAAGLINNGFSALQGVLKEDQSVQNQNFDNHTKINTAAFQDAVAKYQNPDDLKKAMSQGGELDVLRQQLGPNINHDAIRGAADTRMANLMDMKLKDITFQHTMADERVAPLVDKFKALELAGKHDEAAALEGEYQKLGGRDLAGLSAFRDQRAQQINERGMQMQKSNDDHLMSNSNIEHNRAMEGIGQTQANASVRQAAAAEQSAATQGKLATFQIDTGTQDRKTAQAAGMAAALKNSLSAGGNMYADGIYTGNNADELRKFMKDNNVGDGNSNRQAEVINYLGDILKKGVEIKDPNGKVISTLHDIPMSVVKQAIGGATNDFWNIGINTAPAKNMKAILENILSTTAKDSKGTLTSKALTDLQQYTEATNRVTENAPAIAPSRMPSNPYGSKRK